MTKPGKPAKYGTAANARPAPPAVRSYPPRRAAWVLSREAEELDEKDQMYIGHLCRACPEAETVRSLALGFGRMVRGREREALVPWLESAEGGVGEMAGFAQGLRGDIAAVGAALSTEWSAGQTEGGNERGEGAIGSSPSSGRCTVGRAPTCCEHACCTAVRRARLCPPSADRHRRRCVR